MAASNISQDEMQAIAGSVAQVRDVRGQFKSHRPGDAVRILLGCL